VDAEAFVLRKNSTTILGHPEISTLVLDEESLIDLQTVVLKVDLRAIDVIFRA
jgi:hypothetical protein